MTLFEWNQRKHELRLLKAETTDAARLAELAELDKALMAIRADIDAATREARDRNRARDAAIKAAKQERQSKARDRQSQKQVPEWVVAERRDRELAFLARLMSHRTGVNVGAPS